MHDWIILTNRILTHGEEVMLIDSFPTEKKHTYVNQVLKASVLVAYYVWRYLT